MFSTRLVDLGKDAIACFIAIAIDLESAVVS
jgi:hypothetical protein